MNDARGYLAVLHNRNFFSLWLAQIASLTALNSSLFVTIILIQKATDSTTQTAGIIAAYNLPAILLSAGSGIVVDRVSKKTILVSTNAFRIFSQLLMTILAAWGLAGQISTALFVTLIYALIFLTSAVGQLFAPAEGAMIPLLVGREGLFAANSLFTLTVVATQVAAIMIIVPLSIKALGVVNSLLLLTILYVIATGLVSLIPKDTAHPKTVDVRSAWHRTWRDLGEGWGFALKRPAILLAILEISMVAALVFIVGTIAPKYTERVLGLAPEDAIFIFSPAGVGILVASVFVVRYGPRFARHTLPLIGTAMMGLSFIALGLIGSFSGGPSAPLFHLYPELTVTATGAVSIASAFAGIALALILIPAQTAVQEEASDYIRGRVLTVQFTLSNLIGFIPLLLIGGLADLFGIPYVVIGIGVVLLIVAVLNQQYARSLVEHPRKRPVAQPLPMAGVDVSAVRSGDGSEDVLTERGDEG
ncbi:MAG: MFS transporter [Rudaea sp.]